MDRYQKGIAVLILLFVTPLVAHVGLAVVPNYESYVVVSSSMEPTIDTGSIIYVRATDSYRPGEIVTFEKNDRIVTHRIVEASADGFLTKGDANGRADGWHVTEREIIGGLVVAVPIYGHVIQIAKTPIGFVAMVLLPGIVLLAMELRDLRYRA